MEEDKEPKKLNDEFVTFVKKRSQDELPRYTERLTKYINLQNRRAAAVRRHTKLNKPRDPEGKEADNANSEQQGKDEGRVSKRGRPGPSSGSRSASVEPADRCGRRKRKRKRSCGRRRRRKRSCGRKKRRRRSCGRRRKRSCSRRRRRRSCRRRRKRSRRRRRGCGR